MGGGGVFQKDAVLAQDKLLGLGECIVFPAQVRGRKSGTVGLVIREAVDIVDAVGGGERPFVGGEVPDQVGPRRRNGLAPGTGVLLELGTLVGVDLVTDEAGDRHRVFSIFCCWANNTGCGARMLRSQSKCARQTWRGSK